MNVLKPLSELHIGRAGEYVAVCAKHQLDRAYVHRIKNEPQYTRSKGLYLSDLTLAKAIGE